MPKQHLDLIDYFGPLAAWVIFFSVTFVISVTCILWCCVTEQDDETVFAKWGMGPGRHRRRLGTGTAAGGGRAEYTAVGGVSVQQPKAE